jgi:hypothetical protein
LPDEDGGCELARSEMRVSSVSAEAAARLVFGVDLSEKEV